MQVKQSIATFRDSASTMNHLQKMQIKKSVKESAPPANWTAQDIAEYVDFTLKMSIYERLYFQQNFLWSKFGGHKL